MMAHERTIPGLIEDPPMPRRLARPGFAWIAVACLPFAAVAGEGLPRGDARAGGFSPERLEKVRALLEDAVGRKQVAGGSALVARRGKVVYQAAAGMQDVEAGRPIDGSTIFRIASMTKPVTSVAVMVLHDDGKLRLEDPVAKYLPEFEDMKVLVPSADGKAFELVAAERAITVHNLLTHTSGLSYRFINPPQLGRLYVEAAVSDGLVETPGTIGDNVKRLARLPLLHQPGTAWDYSLSTDVLGRLVEVVSGRTLDAFFRERIFRPLKMDDTHFILPKSKRARLATLYTPGEDNVIHRAGTEPVQAGPLVYSATYPLWDDGTYYSGGAGLCSTIGDYARFLQMLLNRGELDGARVLKAETVDKMTRDQLGGLTFQPGPHGDGFGYGFGVVTERNRGSDAAGVGAYSWGGFFYTYFWVDPRRELVGILMTQTYPNGHLRLREDVKRLTYEALEE
jgi:CubicO group peptidase (beta-lactamase class C family)